MGTYRIVEPCNYVHDGKVIQFRVADAVAELDDESAKLLGAKVRRVGEETQEPVEQPQEPEAEAVHEPPPVVEPEPEKPRPRRPRVDADG